MKTSKILSLLGKSLILFPYLNIVAVHRQKKHLGMIYDIEKASKYLVFRDTGNKKPINEKPTILVFHFRLKWIKKNRFWHWLFQRVCIFTTPFWSGLKGFKTKLWMVEPKTKDYLGIYEWRGNDNAQGYVDSLKPILGIFAIKKSMWHRMYPNMELEKYLKPRLYKGEK